MWTGLEGLSESEAVPRGSSRNDDNCMGEVSRLWAVDSRSGELVDETDMALAESDLEVTSPFAAPLDIIDAEGV